MGKLYPEFAISKYYKEVSIEEISKLKEFRDSHPIKSIIYENNRLSTSPQELER